MCPCGWILVFMFSQDVILVTQWETNSDSFEMVSRWFVLLRQQLRVGSTQSAGLALSFVFGSWKVLLSAKQTAEESICNKVSHSSWLTLRERENSRGSWIWEWPLLMRNRCSPEFPGFPFLSRTNTQRKQEYEIWILWWSFKPWNQLDFTSFLHRWWNNAPIYRNAVASSVRSVWERICCMQIKKPPQIYTCQRLKCLFNIIVV